MELADAPFTDMTKSDSDHLDKRERADRGLEELRDMLEEMLEVGDSRHPGIDALADTVAALEGLDAADDALEKWDDRDTDGEWRFTDNDDHGEQDAQAVLDQIRQLVDDRR